VRELLRVETPLLLREPMLPPREVAYPVRLLPLLLGLFMSELRLTPALREPILPRLPVASTLPRVLRLVANPAREPARCVL
jgi:hypothetical protein